MKLKPSRPLGCLRFLLFVTALLLLLLAPPAQAQTTNVSYGQFTNAVLSLTSSQTLTVDSAPVDVWSGKGLGIFCTDLATNSATANVVRNFQGTYDGTNWFSSPLLSVTNALTGTTPANGYVPLPPGSLAGLKKIRLHTVVNAHTATITTDTWFGRQH